MEQISGHFNYQGIHVTQQVVGIKSFFEKLLKEENFNIIIELGTSFGGLTYILDDIIKENNLNCDIHTFDFSYKDYVDESLRRRGCTYYILDERDEVYKSTVKNLLLNKGKCLLLCDGGNKKEEFNTYSEFIKSGDIIMAHDYSYDYETFKNEIENKFWNWFEISYSDIETSVNLFGLEDYKKINFKEAAWACFLKK